MRIFREHFDSTRSELFLAFSIGWLSCIFFMLMVKAHNTVEKPPFIQECPDCGHFDTLILKTDYYDTIKSRR